MTTTDVIVRFSTPGFHCWPDAPDHLAFLRASHFHNFHMAVTVRTLAARGIEFFEFEDRCKAVIAGFATVAPYGYDFGSMSCEELAARLGGGLLIVNFRIVSVEVSEDGGSAAKVRWL